MNSSSQNRDGHANAERDSAAMGRVALWVIWGTVVGGTIVVLVMIYTMFGGGPKSSKDQVWAYIKQKIVAEFPPNSRVTFGTQFAADRVRLIKENRGSKPDNVRRYKVSCWAETKNELGEPLKTYYLFEVSKNANRIETTSIEKGVRALADAF